jgi:hypothetical protein
MKKIHRYLSAAAMAGVGCIISVQPASAAEAVVCSASSIVVAECNKDGVEYGWTGARVHQGGEVLETTVNSVSGCNVTCDISATFNGFPEFSVQGVRPGQYTDTIPAVPTNMSISCSC